MGMSLPILLNENSITRLIIIMLETSVLLYCAIMKGKRRVVKIIFTN